MKFIPDSEKFVKMNSELNFSSVDGAVMCRLETYSCKMIRQEKSSYKKFCGRAPHTTLETLSPPMDDLGLPLYAAKKQKISPMLDLEVVQSLYGGSLPYESSEDLLSTSFCSTTSSVGDDDEMLPLCEDKIVRKTLFHLMSTLEASFYPMYDFSDSKATDFAREPSIPEFERSFGYRMDNYSLGQFSPLATGLWEAIDEAICTKDCELYSFNPADAISDPWVSEGSTWALYYFFFNPRLRRVVFLSCRHVGKNMGLVEDRECLDFQMDFDDC